MICEEVGLEQGLTSDFESEVFRDFWALNESRRA
jgi:hypothetical protein